MLLERSAAELILIVNGRGRRAVVPVVPVVPLVCSRDRRSPAWHSLHTTVNAAFMSFQPHESGIHAVWSGAGEADVTEVRFRCTPQPVARRERTKINSI